MSLDNNRSYNNMEEKKNNNNNNGSQRIMNKDWALSLSVSVFLFSINIINGIYIYCDLQSDYTGVYVCVSILMQPY